MSNRHCSLHGFAETTFWMVMFRMKHRQSERLSHLNEKPSGLVDTHGTQEIARCESQNESLITLSSFLLIVALKVVRCCLLSKWNAKTESLPMCHLNRKNGFKQWILSKMSNHSLRSVQSKQSCLFRNTWLIRRNTIFNFTLWNKNPVTFSVVIHECLMTAFTTQTNAVADGLSQLGPHKNQKCCLKRTWRRISIRQLHSWRKNDFVKTVFQTSKDLSRENSFFIEQKSDFCNIIANTTLLLNRRNILKTSFGIWRKVLHRSTLLM